METTLGILAGGFLLGLAGSLHCACMCGGIASGALFLIDPNDRRERLVTLLVLQAGRITTYAAAGAVVAGVIAVVVDPATTAWTFRILQWLGAFTLMWMGLATAGMLPRLAVPGGGTLSTTALLGPLVSRLRAYPRVSAYVMGLTWGLTPCPMVYAALMSATLAGSAYMGAVWMAGFGAGTLPGVLGAALGVSALSRVRKGPAAEMTAGLLVAAFGFVTLYFGWTPAHLFCRPQ